MMIRTIPLFSLVFLLMPHFLSAQQTLQLNDCSEQYFEINDHSDEDEDGNVCEAKITLSNYAYYDTEDGCQESNIDWTVFVDLWRDGTDDLEFSSSLPSNDNTFDDTNGNGIPDVYIPMTAHNEVQNIVLPDIDGPNSHHAVRWKVTDDCNLIDDCNSEFWVLDKKAPTPFCISLMSFELGPEGAEIFAEDFNIGVFDNCTDQEDIRISFSDTSIVPSMMLNCSHVENSPVLIDIYFWDESDNIDFCNAFIYASHDFSHDCYAEREIHGVVRNWEGVPIEGATVYLHSDLPEFPLVRITDEEGKYSFGILPEGVQYELSVAKDDDYLEGVTTLDAVMIVRHILGIDQFQSPYQTIAADVNDDYAVKATDLTLHRKLILGVISELPSTPSWRFFREDFEFDSASNPFGDLSDYESDPFIYSFKTIDEEGYVFIGTKTGDVVD